MQEFRINIRSFREVQEFISLATVQPFRILVGNESQQVNAKSFIGMVSLDYTRPLTVLCECDREGCLQFQQQASRFGNTRGGFLKSTAARRCFLYRENHALDAWFNEAYGDK